MKIKMKMTIPTTPICKTCAIDGAQVPASQERNRCPVCYACAEAHDQAVGNATHAAWTYLRRHAGRVERLASLVDDATIALGNRYGAERVYRAALQIATHAHIMGRRHALANYEQYLQ